MAWGAATPRREPVLRGSSARQGEGTPRHAEPQLSDVLLTTTPAVEGRAIAAYLGIATGQAVLDAGPLRESRGRFGGLFRSRSAGQEETLAGAQDTALRELKSRAAAKGADAVLGVSLAQAVLGNLLVVNATGTAVRLG